MLVAHAQGVFRAAVAKVLDGTEDLKVVAQASDGRGALEAVQRLRPALAMVAADLPPEGGMKICSAIKDIDVGTRVVLVSDGGDQSFLVQALEAGADGFVAADAGLEDLLGSLRTVAQGHAAVPPKMLGGLLRTLIERRREEDVAVSRFARLSRRERQVLELMVAGQGRTGIADALVISPETARTHVQNVLRKLEVHSQLEAAALVAEHDLVHRFTEEGTP